MLETIVARQIVFYFVGAVIAVGVIAKVIAGISLKRLVKAASNMGKSNHALMRLVRAKFEHACMVSDKVQNVRAFVDKYVYEYKALGMRLHSWRQLEKTSIWLCALISALGAGLSYYVEGLNDAVYQYGILGGAGTVGLFLLYVMTDERYQMEAAKNYMVDFLENTYAHRYEKSNQREIQVTVQKAAEDGGQAGGREVPPVQDPQKEGVLPVEEPMMPPEQDPMQDPIPRPIPQQAPMPVARQEETERSGKSRLAGRRQNRKQNQDFARESSGRQNQESRAASSAYVQSSGAPQNGAMYGGRPYEKQEEADYYGGVNGRTRQEMHTGAERYSEENAYRNRVESDDRESLDHQEKQEFQKEARIREILEEFLA